MIEKISGFSARFELWIGEHCATRRGYRYSYPYLITRMKSAVDAYFTMPVSGDGPWTSAADNFDLRLTNLLLIGDTFISAGLSLRDIQGYPLTMMQMVKLWLPPMSNAKDDTVSSVDEMSYGYWTGHDGILPAVLVSYVKPYA